MVAVDLTVMYPWAVRTMHLLPLLLYYRVTLMKPWTPGQHGAPEASLNTDAFCEELNVSAASPVDAPSGLMRMQAASSLVRGLAKQQQQ